MQKNEFKIPLIRLLYAVISFFQLLTTTFLIKYLSEKYKKSNIGMGIVTFVNLFWFAFIIITIVFDWGNINIIYLMIFRLWEIFIINIWLFIFRQGASKVEHTEKSENNLRLFILLLIQYFTMMLIFSLINKAIFSLNNNSFMVNRLTTNNAITWIYYSVVTITTVGYGDITPVSNIAKMSSISEILFGMFFVLLFITNIIGELKFIWNENK
ncbi:MAG: ion channel [Bacillota bacterium]|nr:ion channel [Bacillota bacterium]